MNIEIEAVDPDGRTVPFPTFREVPLDRVVSLTYWPDSGPDGTDKLVLKVALAPDPA